MGSFEKEFIWLLLVFSSRDPVMEYVKAKNMGDTLRLYSDSKYLKRECRGYLRERIACD